VAQPIVDQLKSGKDVETLGINGEAWVASDGSVSGIWVSSVASGSPAAKAGIQGGDLLLTIEDLPLGGDGTMSAYCSILRSHNPTDTMKVEVFRLETGEFLAGEFNGKELAVTSSSGSGGSGGASGGSGGAAGGGAGAGASGEAPAYFTEEFDAETLDNWSWMVTNGDSNQFGLYTDNGRLVFELNGQNLFTYVFYDPYTYSAVALDTKAENRGKNNNNVGLVCQASQEGWYEFSVANNGLWWLWAYDGNSYSMLANGGSTAVRTGKDVNEYSLVCNENTISMYINGQLIKTFTDKTFVFREGQVGIGVSAFDVLPIKLEFDYITVSQP